MLLRLSVARLGPLASANLEFSPGLNVLTGETGAGKSLLITALGLLTGSAGAARLAAAAVHADFSPGTCEASGAEQRVLRVARRFGSNGRSRVLMDGRSASPAELAATMAQLMSITTQGAVRDLASRDGILDVLDAKPGVRELRARFDEALTAFRGVRAELAALVRSGFGGAGTNAQRDREELLKELERLDAKPGEHSRLEQRLELLSRSQQYLSLAQRVAFVLSDREMSVDSELSQLLAAVRRASFIDSFRRVADELAAAVAAVEGARRQAVRISEELVFEPAELERIESRCTALSRLAARLEWDPDDLPSREREIRAELGTLATAAVRHAALSAELGTALGEAQKRATELHAARLRWLPTLEQELSSELRALALPGARIGLELDHTLPVDDVSVSTLRVAFSGSPGQPQLPVERVASGGERSRIALALACVGAAEGVTLVFDEIDQGTGGHAVQVLAERLQSLARSHQIVCVTHQAAIAARADAHFRVRKTVVDGATEAYVDRLDYGGRTRELSRMLSGDSAASASRRLARRLLAAAERAA